MAAETTVDNISNAALDSLGVQVSDPAVLSLTACSTTSQDSNSIVNMELRASVTAKGVLSAAVLLSTADIDKAVAAGIVSPAEVEAAQKAIKDGTLDQWRQRAEKDK